MNSLIARILLPGLILALPLRVAGAAANFALASASLESKNELTLNESEAVKKDLLELFRLCKSERYSEVARYLVYRGPEKKREWVDIYNYDNLIERREVKAVGEEIKELLEQSDSYQLSSFIEKTESEGQWRVWETIFQKGDKRGKVYFAFLKIKDHYALGDIDGHLAYMRLIKQG